MWHRSKQRWLEGALRAQRAEAPDGLVEDISGKVSAAPAYRRRAWSRVAFASAVSVFVLGTFASFGGLGYASSGASDTYSAVKKIAVAHKLKVGAQDVGRGSQSPDDGAVGIHAAVVERSELQRGGCGRHTGKHTSVHGLLAAREVLREPRADRRRDLPAPA